MDKMTLFGIVAVLLTFEPTGAAAQQINPGCPGIDPRASSFGMPLGTPSGIGYEPGNGGLLFLDPHDYQSKTVPATNGIVEYHPGDDWNLAGNKLDFGEDNRIPGDPVYAIGKGIVKFANYPSDSWGYVVLIEHRAPPGGSFALPNGSAVSVVWSQYGHMASLSVNPRTNQPWAECDVVEGGEQIGKVGDYPAGSGTNYHLHFEVRVQYRPASAFVLNTFLDASRTPQPWPPSEIQKFYVAPSAFVLLNPTVSGLTAAFTMSAGGLASGDGHTLSVDGGGSDAQVTLTAACGATPSGCLTSQHYIWSVAGAAPPPDLATVQVILGPGSHAVTLTVSNDQGLQSSPTSGTVVVNSLSPPPHPNISVSNEFKVDVFNVDDVMRVILNGVDVGHINYFGHASFDLLTSPYLRSGPNSLGFVLNNATEGWTYGFRIHADGATVVERVCGNGGSYGCNGNQQGLTGPVFTDFYTVIMNGEVLGITTPTPHFTMSSGGLTKSDGEQLTVTAGTSGSATVTFADTSDPGNGCAITSRTWVIEGLEQVSTATSFSYDLSPGGVRSVMLTLLTACNATPAASGEIVVQPLAPTLTDMLPHGATVSPNDQSVQFSGTGFQQGLTISVAPPRGGTSTLSGAQIQNVGPTSIDALVTFADPGTYTFAVINPDGGTSAPFTFAVSQLPLTSRFILGYGHQQVSSGSTLDAVLTSTTETASVTLSDVTDPGDGVTVTSREWHVDAELEPSTEATITREFGTNGAPTRYTITLNEVDSLGRQGSASATVVVLVPFAFYAEAPLVGLGRGVADDSGALYYARTEFGFGCGFGVCSHSLLKISTGGNAEWIQQPQPSGDSSPGVLYGARVALSPTGHAYFWGDRSTLYAYSSDGSPVAGNNWPFTIPPTNATFTGAPSVDAVTGELFPQVGGTFVALHADGSEMWRNNNSFGNGFLGPGRQIYMVGQFGFGIYDRETGGTVPTGAPTPICQTNGPGSGSLNVLATPSQVLVTVSPFSIAASNPLPHNAAGAYQPDCSFQTILVDQGRGALQIWDYRRGAVVATDRNENIFFQNTDPQLLGFREDGTNLWRNPFIIPAIVGGSNNPVLAGFGGISYVAGYDRTDGSRYKLFGVLALTGEIVRQIPLDGICTSTSCAAVVDQNGNLYIHELLNGTPVFKIPYPF